MFAMLFPLAFGSPWILFGLLVPVALLAWTWMRRAGRVVLPFDHGQQGAGTWLRLVMQSAESLPPLVLAVAVLMMAGPQQTGAPIERRALTNIEFCLDVSGSMAASFGEGTRYDAAMQAINDFLEYREGDAFGLTFFGNSVLHWVPLTTDVSAFRCAPPFMDPRTAGRPHWFGGTEIGRALKSCRSVLIEREEGDRMIILVSDGYSSDLSNGVDAEIAKMMRGDGIVVYGIHVGGGRVPDPVVNIAVASGGEVFEVDDPAVFDTVFARIDEMQRTEIEKIATEPVDDFELLSYIGLGAVALHLLLQLFLRYTPW